MIGEVVAGRYRVERALGEGGGAGVFFAEDTAGGRPVAMKFFPPVRASTEEFRREAAAAHRARHPNLIGLLDAGVREGAPWLALEFVEGRDVRVLLEERLPSRDEAVAVGIGVFAALDALHRAGMAHGDIKPENVLLRGERVRVVDFGRARLHHLLDGRGMFPGTPPYMHPSLFHGGMPTGGTDCFATWVMFYELISGERPWTAPTLRWVHGDTLPERLPLADPVLERIVEAGLTGALPDARSGEVALRRYARGRTDVARGRPEAAVPPDDVVDGVLARARDRGSLAIVGDADLGRALLRAAHRRWEGRSLWISADEGFPGVPMSGALCIPGHAAEGLDGDTLARVAQRLGPLGAVLGDANPAARAWLGGDRRDGIPPGDRLALALRRFFLACPQPLLLFVDGLDRLDGASRRFLAALVSTGELRLVGTAAPGAPHGMPHVCEIEEATLDSAPEAAPSELLLRARVLALPMGRLLASAAGVTAAAVEDAALDAEAVGQARWTGAEVVPRPGRIPPAAVASGWLREAAERLDATEEPLLVARYAMQGGDAVRLGEVADAAIDEAVRRDPAEALAIFARDPRPETPERARRHFRTAVAARDLSLAQALLPRCGGPVDIAEAEAELAFHEGRDSDAITAYHRVAGSLGFPLLRGLPGAFLDAWARFSVVLRRPVRPRPAPRASVVFERLFDLYSLRDHRPLVRVHRHWLAAAPEQPRARAMDTIWQAALGRHAVARRMEVALGESDASDPSGAAVALLHRSIARGLRGETVDAFTDGVDAAERLLVRGDAYLAAHAISSVVTTGVHLGAPGTMARLLAELRRVAEAVGDARAARWAEGSDGVVAWLVGDVQGATEALGRWAETAGARGEIGEAVAARLLADLAVDRADHVSASRWASRCRDATGRVHASVDFLDAVAVAEAIAGNGRRRSLDRLAARSPRWTARAMAARGWMAAREGGDARPFFDRALRDAQERQQVHDVWFVFRQRALALGDAAAADAATAVAIEHGLKAGLGAVRR